MHDSSVCMITDSSLSFYVHGYTSMCFTIFTKGNNFCDVLFASLVEATLPKWSLVLLKEEKFLLLRRVDHY